MATYVNDLRLTELATGEGSGTWGTTTNTNLELIGEALGYGTQDCFASDADATTTVADGASDPARAMYFKVTSSATLTATRTLTIAPNTVSRVMLIENATTGSQSIAISQGSGGNVTIASGQTKMVYLDGAGSGAAVVDALADLELGTITVADLTATTADINGGTIDGATLGGSSQVTITDADMNGGTIDGVTIGGSSAGAGSFTTLTASGDANFDSGTLFVDASADSVGIGTSSPDRIFHVSRSSASVISGKFESASTSGSQIVFKDADTTTNDLQVRIGSDANDLVQYAGGSERLRIDSSGNVGIGTTSPDTLLDLEKNSTGTSTGTYPEVTVKNTNASGIAGFRVKAANAAVDGSLTALTDQVRLATLTNDPLTFMTNSAERMRIDSSGAVGIGTTSPDGFVDINQPGTTSTDGLFIYSGDNPADGGVLLYKSGSALGTIQPLGASGQLSFNTFSGAEAARIDTSGNLLVGTTDNNVTNNSTEAGAGINVGTAGIKGLLASARWQGPPALFNRMSNDGDIVIFNKDGSTVGSIGTTSGRLYIGDGDVALRFADDLDFIAPWNASTNAARDAAIGLGNSGNRFKDLYLSGGVYLGGTAAANLLDDYETGTFTPAFAFSTSGSVTYTGQEGQYVKTGDLVTCTLRLTLSGLSSPAGNVTITGLPFTNGTGEEYVSSASLGIVRNLNTARPDVRAYINSNTTQLSLSVNATDAGFSAMGSSDLTASTSIYLTVSYRAA